MAIGQEMVVEVVPAGRSPGSTQTACLAHKLSFAHRFHAMARARGRDTLCQCNAGECFTFSNY